MQLPILESGECYVPTASANCAPFTDYPKLLVQYFREKPGPDIEVEPKWGEVLDERPLYFGCGKVRREVAITSARFLLHAFEEELYEDTIGGPRCMDFNRELELETADGLKAKTRGAGLWIVSGPLDERIDLMRFVHNRIGGKPQPEAVIRADAMGYRTDTLPTRVTNAIAREDVGLALAILSDFDFLAPHTEWYAEAKAQAGMYLNRMDWLSESIEVLKGQFPERWGWMQRQHKATLLQASLAIMEGDYPEAERLLAPLSFDGEHKPYSFSDYALVYLRLKRLNGWSPAQQRAWLQQGLDRSLPVFHYGFNPTIAEIK
jgi:hypothetical protein